ncbi:MAG: radical SAM protein [Actinomycetota bacterium]|nr:radical SAM protein [Actinomycetota bacterium]
MRVLVVASNRYKGTVTSFPNGASYMAGAAAESGHQVEVFDCLFAGDLKSELTSRIERFRPDVTAVSIQFVHAVRTSAEPVLKASQLDLREGVREVTDCIKRASSSPIVLGGPGFNYFGPEWLERLDLDYGIRGEAERTFPAYLERLEAGADTSVIPGCVYRDEDRFLQVPRQPPDALDTTAFPVFEPFDLGAYRDCGTYPGISTKRGCRFRCTHCPYSGLEGTRYRLKSPARVVDEVERALESGDTNSVHFCDNLFNFPREHAESICRELIARDIDLEWSTGLTPLGVTEDFCRLLKAAGCVTGYLDVEFASDKMLRRMHRGYRTRQIREAIDNLDKVGIPFAATLLLGGPGETPETIAGAMDLVNAPPRPRFITVSIGIAMWTNHQRIVDYARKEGQLTGDGEFFEGAFYLSPELPRDFMQEFVEKLDAQENCARYHINKASWDEVITMVPWESYDVSTDTIMGLHL